MLERLGKAILIIIVFSVSFSLNTLTYASEYSDVNDKAWYSDAVSFVSEHGLMTGTSKTRFSPNDYLSRGQVVVILYRMAGCPAIEYSNVFEDVLPNRYYTSAVLWALDNGITTGYDEHHFGPDNPILRQDFMVMLSRYCETYGTFSSYTNEMLLNCKGKVDFPKVSKYAKTSIVWAFGHKLIGVNSRLKPHSNITRAEAATIIMRYIQNEDRQIINFSVDDGCEILNKLTLNDYSSIFEEENFAFFKSLHDMYGLKLTVYLYYTDNQKSFRLDDVTMRYREEFEQNSDWIKFGYHAINSVSYQSYDTNLEKNYYSRTISNIIRFAGSEKSIDRFVRLDRFFSQQETIAVLAALPNGVMGLFTPDSDSRTAFGFGRKKMKYINTHEFYRAGNNIRYTATDIRLENMEGLSDLVTNLNKKQNEKVLAVFTHEWKLSDSVVKEYIEYICKYAAEWGRSFDYL